MITNRIIKAALQEELRDLGIFVSNDDIVMKNGSIELYFGSTDVGSEQEIDDRCEEMNEAFALLAHEYPGGNDDGVGVRTDRSLGCFVVEIYFY